MKRLLAYSTIAHAGYMMMPVAAAVALVGGDAGRRPDSAVAALVFYVAIYLFMNLGAFAIVAFLRNATGSEEIADYAGLIRRSPGLAVCMAIILFSLVGLPPLAGFCRQVRHLRRPGSTPDCWCCWSIGGLNTVLSLFYYLRVVRVMVFAAGAGRPPRAGNPAVVDPRGYCAVLTLPLVALFFWWDGLFAGCRRPRRLCLF